MLASIRENARRERGLCLAGFQKRIWLSEKQLLNLRCRSGHLRMCPVVTESSVRFENTGVPISRELMVATTMSSLFVAFFALIGSTFRTRAALHAEILALRHQLAVFQKNAPRRLLLHRCDRLLWVVLYRCWSGWRRCLQMVQPDTVLRWHRRAFACIGPENRATCTTDPR